MNFRRANWPAQDHFHRIMAMASSWSKDPSNGALLDKISVALDHWFDRDFTEDDCINAGGKEGLKCPCGTPGLWNTNWYDQMILIPGLVGNACLLMATSLTPTQLSNCTTQTSRAYVRIEGDPNGSMGAMTGANLLDVSSIGVTLALMTSNQNLLVETVNRFYDECQLTSGADDGIKVDGSFMQHDNQLYSGNYGQVFMRNMLKIFIETSNTTLLPPESVQTAFKTVIEGSEWFIYLKDDPTGSRILSWQYSAIGRMVSHKYEDWHGIGLDLGQILEGTKGWDNYDDFELIVNRLRSQGSNANPGPLIGTRFFHTSDFLVHRGPSYIVTLKMFSSRTSNSECNNGQNPFGFHLSDGVIYAQLKGSEYTNVYGAWDWDLLPGATIDYGATPLQCSSVQFKGLDPFVGGVTLDHNGIGVMNYTNPLTQSLTWVKTFFFAPNSYTVQFVGNSASDAAADPVYTTLDQRQRSGPVYIDGGMMDEPAEGILVRQVATTLWHDRVGYEFLYPIELTVDTRVRYSDWEAIGISVGNETQSILVVYFEHQRDEDDDRKYTYTAHLDIDLEEFLKLGSKSSGDLGRGVMPTEDHGVTKALAVVRGTYSGYDDGLGVRVVSLAFLTSGEFETNLEDIVKVETDAPILLIFQSNPDNSKWLLAVADPSQGLVRVRISVTLMGQTLPIDLNVELPSGPWAGSTHFTEF